MGYKFIWWLYKWVLIGPAMRLVFHPKATGVENIPAEGPVILASNHLSFSDSFFMPLMVPRPVYFLAKSDYFTAAPSQVDLLLRTDAAHAWSVSVPFSSTQ